VTDHDPNALRMVTATICWYCCTGEHARCCYHGRYPDHRMSGLLADCFCARIRHPAQIADGGKSTQLYDVAGREVFPTPGGTLADGARSEDPPCPRDGCAGVLIRPDSGVVECTKGHAGSPGPGHISWE
jgi:hypothetical protein